MLDRSTATMMETTTVHRGRGFRVNGAAGSSRGHSKNRKWVAGEATTRNSQGTDPERWERGGYRSRGGGRGGRSGTPSTTHLTVHDTGTRDDGASGTEDERGVNSEMEDTRSETEAEGQTLKEREAIYKMLKEAHDVERVQAIAEGKMDDPAVPKRLDEAITMVGTCKDMCPRYERYKREREKRLDRWEVIPGTKLVDHKRAVKIYERGAGDKVVPSDIRPPPVLRKTLDYLFHDLLMRGGFSETHDFIRDRSRAVRNDFTLQHETGPIAIECHDRCARFHIVSMHLERTSPKFSLILEEQQLMNTLQSLKEFYEDQRGRYQASTELEMRVYHRLVHIRDQKERHEDIPEDITGNPVFQHVTHFRLHVQKKSSPITKTSQLVVDADAMAIFGQLVMELRRQKNVVMIYLVACILERLFGPDTVEDIESIRGDLSIPDIIDGISHSTEHDASATDAQMSDEDEVATEREPTSLEPAPTSRGLPETQSVFSHTASATPARQTASAFGNLTATPNAFGTSTTSVFGGASSFGGSSTLNTSPFGSKAAFGTAAPTVSISGYASSGDAPRSVFGTAFPVSSTPTPAPSFSAPQLPSSSFDASPFGQPNGASSPFGAFSSPAVKTSTSAPASAFGGASFGNTAPPPEYIKPGSIFSGPLFATSSSTALSTPEKPAVQEAPKLNPFASAFTPPKAPENPFQTNPTFSTPPPPPSFPTPPPALAVPSTVKPDLAQPVNSSAPVPNFFSSLSLPAFTLPASTPSVVPPPSTSAPAVPSSAAAPSPGAAYSPTPAKIVERRQTLWEIPSASTSPTPPPPIITDTLVTPSAPKADPLSLPPTPTARWFDPSSGAQARQVDSSSLLRKRTLAGLQIPSELSNGMLSPLALPSPTASKLFSAPRETPPTPPTPSPQPQPSTSAPFPSFPAPPGSHLTPSDPEPAASIAVNGHAPPANKTEKAAYAPSSKGKEKAANIIIDAQAAHLAQACSIRFMGDILHHWRARWRERVEQREKWDAAKRESEAYLKRTRPSAANHARSASPPKGKWRRQSYAPEVPEKSLFKRAKRRSEGFVMALAGEELAKRLQQDREENERRWAQGTFLRTVRERLTQLAAQGAAFSLSDWRLWLSLNPERDETAIWLQQKFDVPEAGGWQAENIFSIPGTVLLESQDSSGSPGLIVFEQTPLEGFTDELHKKAKVLEDAMRLQEIMDSLPPANERRFRPSLVIIAWNEVLEDDLDPMARQAKIKADADIAAEFTNLVNKLQQSKVVRSVETFPISSTSTDLDTTFQEIVSRTALDLHDRLSVSLSWHEVQRMFVSPFAEAIRVWLASCWTDDDETMDTSHYDHVFRAILESIDAIVHALAQLYENHRGIAPIKVPRDLQVSGMDADYAVGPYLDAVVEALVSNATQAVGSPDARPRPFQRADVSNFEAQIRSDLDSFDTKLATLAARSQASKPRRRGADEADLDENPSGRAKRARSESDSSRDGQAADISVSASPPPSVSTALSTREQSLQPFVTPAMLRALARDVLKRRK